MQCNQNTIALILSRIVAIAQMDAKNKRKSGRKGNELRAMVGVTRDRVGHARLYSTVYNQVRWTIKVDSEDSQRRGF